MNIKIFAIILCIGFNAQASEQNKIQKFSKDHSLKDRMNIFSKSIKEAAGFSLAGTILKTIKNTKKNRHFIKNQMSYNAKVFGRTFIPLTIILTLPCALINRGLEIKSENQN